MNKHTERLRVFFDGILVGVFAAAGKSKIIFEYAPEWIANGFDPAPRSLKWR